MHMSLCDATTFKDAQSSCDGPSFVTIRMQPNEFKLVRVKFSHLFVVVDH
jgi:hypothetical protein